MCGNRTSVISSPSLYQETFGVGCPSTRTSNLAALPSSIERSFNGAVNEGGSPSDLDLSSVVKKNTNYIPEQIEETHKQTK